MRLLRKLRMEQIRRFGGEGKTTARKIVGMRSSRVKLGRGNN